MLVEMPAASSLTEFIALAAVYCALRTSFCERKLFTRFCSSASPCSSFSCFLGELLALRLQVVDLALGRALPRQRLAGQVLPALRRGRSWPGR